MIAFLQAHRFLIGQIFGFCAMATGIIMYQFKKHRTIMLLMMLCSAFWCLHFLLLGKYTAVSMNVLNVIRAVLFSFRGRRWADHVAIPVAICAAVLGVTALTWEGPLSLLPAAASVSATIAGWQKDTKRLKLFTIPVCVGWFIYNAFCRSYAGMLNETLVLGSVIVALARLRKGTAAPPETAMNRSDHSASSKKKGSV